MDRVMGEFGAAFFDGWSGVLVTLVATPIMYVAVIAFIRLAGKRSTSQMNNFDWVVTVALGSIVASGVVLNSVPLIEALLAVGLLLALQMVLTHSLQRREWLANLVKAEPRLLVHDGRFIRSALHDERVTEQEVRAAIREHGLTSVRDARWVVLETDATFSVIPRSAEASPTDRLEGVHGYPPRNDGA